MHTKTSTILESTESSSVALEGIPNEKKRKKKYETYLSVELKFPNLFLKFFSPFSSSK